MNVDIEDQFNMSLPQGFDTPLNTQTSLEMIELIAYLNGSGLIDDNILAIDKLLQVMRKLLIHYGMLGATPENDKGMRDVSDTNYQRPCQVSGSGLIKVTLGGLVAVLIRKVSILVFSNIQNKSLREEVLVNGEYMQMAFIAMGFRPSREVCKYALACAMKVPGGKKSFISAVQRVLAAGTFAGAAPITEAETERLNGYLDLISLC